MAENRKVTPLVITLGAVSGVLALVGFWCIFIYSRVNVVTGQSWQPYAAVGWLIWTAGMIGFVGVGSMTGRIPWRKKG